MTRYQCLRTIAVVLSATLVTLNSANGASFGGPGGGWPKDWPKELEPLRKQAWTWEHGLVGQVSYEIPFESREQFEKVWPRILELKSKGATLTLRRGPHLMVKSRKKAGVRIFPPLRGRATGRYALTRIELVVDGQIVDLNRIQLPADTSIVDARFEAKKTPNQKKGKKK